MHNFPDMDLFMPWLDAMVGRRGMVAVVWSPWCSRRGVVAVPPVKASHPLPPPPPHQKVWFHRAAERGDVLVLLVHEENEEKARVRVRRLNWTCAYYCDRSHSQQKEATRTSPRFQKTSRAFLEPQRDAATGMTIGRGKNSHSAFFAYPPLPLPATSAALWVDVPDPDYQKEGPS